MKAIWKYQLKGEALQSLVMPAGAEILHAHEQDGVICLWAQVDTRQTYTEQRQFRIIATGEAFDGLRYIGTAHLQAGRFVFHVFEVKR